MRYYALKLSRRDLIYSLYLQLIDWFVFDIKSINKETLSFLLNLFIYSSSFLIYWDWSHYQWTIKSAQKFNVWCSKFTRHFHQKGDDPHWDHPSAEKMTNSYFFIDPIFFSLSLEISCSCYFIPWKKYLDSFYRHVQ